MTAADVPSPTPSEQLDQLDRILSSADFVGRERESAILRLLVHAGIEGRVLTDQDIRDELFKYGGYTERGSIARTHVKAVRDHLNAYNLAHALSDRVRFALPKRSRGYKSEASYASDRVLLRNGYHALSQLSPFMISRAHNAFDFILDSHPDIVAALIGKVHCLSFKAVYGGADRSPLELLTEALVLAWRLTSANPTYAEASLAAAGVLLCRGEALKAWTQLNGVFLSDASVVKRSLLYPLAFLLLGYPHAAGDAAEAIASEQPEQALLWAIAGIFKYFSGQFEYSEKLLDTACLLDADCWLGNLGIALLYASINKFTQGLDRFITANRHLGSPKIFMPGLGALLMQRAHDVHPSIPRVIDEIKVDLSEVEDSRKDWIQIALSAMDHSPEQAVTALEAAHHYVNPLIFLLPYWPIFDPLRGRTDFQVLVAKIKDSVDPQES